MNLPISRILLLTTLLSGFNIAVAADGALNIETAPQGTTQPKMKRALINIPLPPRGMNKSALRGQFGQPLRVRPAVGEPPISSWGYADYTVYFEGNWVIRSVLNRK